MNITPTILETARKKVSPVKPQTLFRTDLGFVDMDFLELTIMLEETLSTDLSYDRIAACVMVQDLLDYLRSRELDVELEP